MKNLLKGISDVFNGILVILLIPLIIILIIPVIIFLPVFLFIEKVKKNIELKLQLRKNNGQIFFIYADYNEIDLSQFLQYIDEDIKCIKVVRNQIDGVLENYLIKKNQTKAYPRLTKIDQDNLIHKIHYGSFKNLVKKNNDIEGFYMLLGKSIKSLQS